MKGLYTLVILATTICCRAQAPYNFFHLFLDKGLSDARVNAIVQDKFGFMWFATPNGLNRYDGYSIKTFYSDREQNGLPSNTITCLYSSHQGELWVGTSNGLVKYDFVKERFLPPDTAQKTGAAISRATVNDFEEDKAGNIYIACGAGIFRLLSKEKKWESIGDHLQTKGLRMVRRLKFFSEDLLLAATYNNIPFFSVNIKTNRLDSIGISINGICCPNMYGIEKLNEEEVLVGLLSYGVLKVNVKTKEYSFLPGQLGKNDSIRYNTVYDILKDSRGRVWMASFYFRLAEYLPAENRLATFEKDPYNPYGFDGNSAVCIYEDRQHNIWTGTGGKGVYRFNPDNNAVKFYAGNDFIPGALQAGPVLSLSVIDSNTLFVGNEQGPSFYDYHTRLHKNFKGIAVTGINAPVEHAQSGLADKDGNIIWIGSNRLGLMRYDRKTGSFRCFSRVTTPFPLQDDGISDMLQLPDGNLFLIGYGRPGFFDTKILKYYSFRNDSVNDVLKLTDVTGICYNSKQQVWLCTRTGKLYKYDASQKILTDRSALLSSVKALTAIYKISIQNDELYLATNAGLVVAKENTAARVFLLKHQDHTMDEIRGVLPDGGYVWFCNNRVLGRLNMSTGKLIFLGERDGLANVQLFTRTLVKSPQGSILIGSNKGYYEIFGDRIKSSDSSAAPYLTGFRVYDKPLATGEAISGLERIELSYRENFFTFDMSSFHYDQAEDIEYAYKLENFDKDWNYPGKQRSGSYTNVPGGKYVLLMKSRNSSGEWKESSQRITIKVGKHFSGTLWFRLLILSLIAGIIYIIYRSRIRQINKEAMLRSDYEIKLNELENSALRTQMNPHFIFNSLNTINSFISRNETIQAHQYISKFSKLIRYILDHSRERKILLSDELEVLNLYIQIERIRFENKFNYEVKVADDIDASAVELPPLIVQPFVENAILHGLLPLETNGFLKIIIERRNDMLYCTVEDNGIGREKAKALKKAYLSTHKSHGIEITLKRIELFNKEHGKEGTVQIVDLPEGGTRVEIPVAWEESF